MHYKGVFLLGSLMLCLDFLVHLVKSLIGKRILVYQISDNDKKDGRDDSGEPQDCVLYGLAVITYVSIISIYRSADE